MLSMSKNNTPESIAMLLSDTAVTYVDLEAEDTNKEEPVTTTTNNNKMNVSDMIESEPVPEITSPTETSPKSAESVDAIPVTDDTSDPISNSSSSGGDAKSAPSTAADNTVTIETPSPTSAPTSAPVPPYPVQVANSQSDDSSKLIDDADANSQDDLIQAVHRAQLDQLKARHQQRIAKLKRRQHRKLDRYRRSHLLVKLIIDLSHDVTRL